MVFSISSKKTKIVATIGPASENPEILCQMMCSGMNVARLNFSHGTYEAHARMIKTIRETAEKLGKSVGILADLQGPRIRVGNTEKFDIEDGEIIAVSDKVSGAESKELVIDSEGVAEALEIGNRILVEDGLMELQVISNENGVVKAKIIHGGTIKPRKGINVPDTKLKFGAITKKDEEDLKFALSQDVDFVALSFVSNAEEIEELREKIKKQIEDPKNAPQIVAKIERQEAIKNIDSIIASTDVVMVARGDLGIEMSSSRVVLYQKEIIAKSLAHTKPVIVATQMLDSMINNPIPTRAEVSDVSNAVIDHTDAVMLSGESANGKYPVKTVQTMAEIIGNTEASPFDDINPGFLHEDIITDYSCIIDSAHELCKTSKAKAILMYTDSGFTARLMSHHRTEQIMLAATNSLKTYRQLSLVWGIDPYLFNNDISRDNFVSMLIDRAKEEGKLKEGDKIVVVMERIINEKKTKLVCIQDVA